jgi:hypothetical protein
MTDNDACYVCGSAELAAGADPRNPTCAEDIRARAHVVSMRTDGGDSVAVCPCGWESRVPWARRGEQDALVRAHWLAQREAVDA